MKVIAPPAISAAVALLLVATPAASAASDKPASSAAARHSEQAVPPGFATWAEVYALQDRLNATAQRILQAGDPGNPSIVADPLRRALLVYWKGDVPPAVRAEAAAAGVPVRFLPAAYTLRELTAEAQRLVGDGRVVEAAPKADASGLTATVPRTVPGTTILSAAGIPVTVTAGDPPRATGRQADTPQFWGGARYTVIANRPCSTGFTVKREGLPLPSRLMLTAAHCARSTGGNVTITGQPDPAGTVEAGSMSDCRDTMLLQLPNGAAGSVYTSSWNSANGAVVGQGTGITAEPDFVGNLVTTSGAGTGEHANLRVEAVNAAAQFLDVTRCLLVTPLIRARTTSAQCAVGPGDSGGPVWSGTAIRGRGTIVGGTEGVEGERAGCPSAAPSGAPQLGFKSVFYAPSVSALAATARLR